MKMQQTIDANRNVASAEGVALIHARTEIARLEKKLEAAESKAKSTPQTQSQPQSSDVGQAGSDQAKPSETRKPSEDKKPSPEKPSEDKEPLSDEPSTDEKPSSDRPSGDKKPAVSEPQSETQQPPQAQKSSEDAKPAQNGESSTSKAQPKPPPSATEQFDLSFPNGYAVVETDSEDFLCGFFAIIESLKAMGVRRPPTVDELYKAFEDKEVEADLTAGMTTEEILNKNWFGGDQLARILRCWGEQTGQDIRLGYLTETADGSVIAPILLWHPRESDPGIVTVWIHNALGVHWSGLRRA